MLRRPASHSAAGAAENDGAARDGRSYEGGTRVTRLDRNRLWLQAATAGAVFAAALGLGIATKSSSAPRSVPSLAPPVSIRAPRASVTVLRRDVATPGLKPPPKPVIRTPASPAPAPVVAAPAPVAPIQSTAPASTGVSQTPSSGVTPSQPPSSGVTPSQPSSGSGGVVHSSGGGGSTSGGGAGVVHGGP
jgi:uncharacterized membrane protein YgcG